MIPKLSDGKEGSSEYASWRVFRIKSEASLVNLDLDELAAGIEPCPRLMEVSDDEENYEEDLDEVASTATTVFI